MGRMNERDQHGSLAPSAAFGGQPREGATRSPLRREQAGEAFPEPSLPSQRLLWCLFATALVASFSLHEIGHCAVAWAHGCPAVPTPCKEYILEPLSAPVRNAVSLGGIAGSVTALLLALGWFLRRSGPTRSAILAGRLLAGAFAAFVAVVVLQSVNNAVFDPLFEPPPAQAGG